MDDDDDDDDDKGITLKRDVANTPGTTAVS
jgi:hypothetical protein